MQERLKRRMLLENPATYVKFAGSTMGETEFISDVVRRTGCGLLLDVNNVHVSWVNQHRDPRACIEALPLHAVGEIHLAGFACDVDAAGDPPLIDSHGAPVAQAVWNLHAFALDRLGPLPTLIECDNDIPALPVLLADAVALPLARFELHPSLAVLRSRHAVVSLWAAHQKLDVEAGLARIDMEAAEAAQVLRVGLDVEISRIGVGAAEFIGGLLATSTGCRCCRRNSRHSWRPLPSTCFRC